MDYLASSENGLWCWSTLFFLLNVFLDIFMPCLLRSARLQCAHASYFEALWQLPVSLPRIAGLKQTDLMNTIIFLCIQPAIGGNDFHEYRIFTTQCPYPRICCAFKKVKWWTGRPAYNQEVQNYLFSEHQACRSVLEQDAKSQVSLGVLSSWSPSGEEQTKSPFRDQ